MISSKPGDGCMQLLMNKLIYPKVFWKLYDQDEKIITITKPQDPESDYTFELGEIEVFSPDEDLGGSLATLSLGVAGMARVCISQQASPLLSP